MKKFVLFIIIVGIGAAAAYYYFLPALEKAKAKRTLSDIRNVGTAMMSWLTDQVGQNERPGRSQPQPGHQEVQYASFAPPLHLLIAQAGLGAGEESNAADKRDIHVEIKDPKTPSVTFKLAGTEVTLKKIPYDSLRFSLNPQDKFFYMQDVPQKDGWGHELEFYCNSNLLANNVFLVRSPGKDGKFSGTSYDKGEFDAASHDEDIVWMDGFFLRYPGIPETK